MIGIRNAPTLLNAAYSPLQFWDGRATSLEEQSAVPIADPVEMNQTHEVSVSKIGEDPAYQAEFAQAFGPGTVTLTKIQKSLASFERTLLSGNSPFDQYQYGGKQTGALTRCDPRSSHLPGPTARQLRCLPHHRSQITRSSPMGNFITPGRA